MCTEVSNLQIRRERRHLPMHPLSFTPNLEFVGCDPAPNFISVEVASRRSFRVMPLKWITVMFSQDQANDVWNPVEFKETLRLLSHTEGEHRNPDLHTKIDVRLNDGEIGPQTEISGAGPSNRLVDISSASVMNYGWSNPNLLSKNLGTRSWFRSWLVYI